MHWFTLSESLMSVNIIIKHHTKIKLLMQFIDLTRSINYFHLINVSRSTDIYVHNVVSYTHEIN